MSTLAQIYAASDEESSLREAIHAANLNIKVDACEPGELITDTIHFSVSGTIPLTEELSIINGGPLVIDAGDIHVFPVVVPMTASLPESTVQHQGCFGFYISRRPVFIAPVGKKRIPDFHPFWMKKRHPGGLIVEAEQIQRFTQLAMISFNGFFTEFDIGLEIFFIKKRRPINPLKLSF